MASVRTALSQAPPRAALGVGEVWELNPGLEVLRSLSSSGCDKHSTVGLAKRTGSVAKSDARHWVGVGGLPLPQAPTKTCCKALG